MIAAERFLRRVFLDEPLCGAPAVQQAPSDGKDSKVDADNQRASEKRARSVWQGRLDARLLAALARLPSCLLDVIICVKSDRVKEISPIGRDGWLKLLDCLHAVQKHRAVSAHSPNCACNLATSYSPVLSFTQVMKDLSSRGCAACAQYQFHSFVAQDVRFEEGQEAYAEFHVWRAESVPLLGVRRRFVPGAYDTRRSCVRCGSVSLGSRCCAIKFVLCRDPCSPILAALHSLLTITSCLVFRCLSFID